MFEFGPHSRIETRKNFAKLRQTNMGQKTISYFGLSLWNAWPDSIKKASSLNNLKHNVKKH